MLARIALFSLGILFLQQLPLLPSLEWLLLLPLVLFAAWRWLRWSFWVLLGMLWCGGHAIWLLHYGIDAQFEGQDLLLRGEIVSIPETREHGLRFLFAVEPDDDLSRPLGLIQLNWYGRAQAVQLGERWQLKVRLKQPNGFVNPGGFDYEGWLFQQRIRATGYVRAGKGDYDENLRLSGQQGHWLDRQRLWLSRQIDRALPESEFVGMIKALSIGFRQQMSDEQWQVLTATGTNHLMAISGLHVGLVAGMAIWMVARLWRFSALLCLYFPARKAGAMAGILAALFYAALAGFAIPTQRALIMLTVALVGVLLQRQLSVAPILAIAWLLVLLLDPFATLSMGFWLSFFAVAIILYSMGGRSHTRSLGWRWGRVHWVISIGLLPLLVFGFQQAPLYSFIANFIAVPVVGLLVVPLVLLSSLLMYIYSDLADGLLFGVELIFQWLWPLLQMIAAWPAAQWLQHQPPLWTMLCAVLGVLLLLAPRGWPGRWLGLIWVAPMLWVMPPRPAEGELWLTVLDVGQGLSVVVQTEHYNLVYDAGPVVGRLDSAERVVVPYLRSQGITKVDRVIISHDDNDHSGGANSLLSGVDVDLVMTPAIERFMDERHQTCRAGQSWQWDGVTFKVLHPLQVDDWRKDNNRSCVVRIQSEGGRVLLPGDVEQRAEKALVDEYGSNLNSDILLAGHHGSKSSSSERFVEMVSPDYVIYSSGYRNRYGFPHAEVVKRFALQEAKQLNSAESGGMQFKISPQQGILAPEEFRISMERLWRRH